MRAQPLRPRPAYHIFNLGFSRCAPPLPLAASAGASPCAPLGVPTLLVPLLIQSLGHCMSGRTYNPAVRKSSQHERRGVSLYHWWWCHHLICALIRWGASLSKSAATHKATKAALTQLTRSLAEELQEAGARS